MYVYIYIYYNSNDNNDNTIQAPVNPPPGPASLNRTRKLPGLAHPREQVNPMSHAALYNVMSLYTTVL